jgi:hypothetical protein
MTVTDPKGMDAQDSHVRREEEGDGPFSSPRWSFDPSREPRAVDMEAEQEPQPDTASPGGRSALVERALDLIRVDFPPELWLPERLWLALAALISIIGSLAADVVLVAVSTSAFPATKGYGHFRFSDYGKLTVVGVVIACVAWPIVVRISSSPRWLFFRLAVLVTLFLWLPDLYILWKGQPAKAVAVLMVMHLAIAVVTYNALIHVAPARPARRAGIAVPR